MEYSEFIFVDYENVQGFELSSLDEKTKIYIFVEGSRGRSPSSWSARLRPGGTPSPGSRSAVRAATPWTSTSPITWAS